MLSAQFKTLKRYHLTLFIIFFFSGKVFAQESEIDIYSMLSCDRILAQAKSPAERTALQRDYWAVLGIVNELSVYRQAFLKDNSLINIFPTAYYHTTVNELQDMVKGKFNYPIEQLRIMIAFYDAYKMNRQLWDKGNKELVEEHWSIHFKLAERHDNITWFSGFVLTSAIVAHVRCDLPRAIRYAYQNRFRGNMLKTDGKYSSDFFEANSIFKKTAEATEKDISKTSIVFAGFKYTKSAAVPVLNVIAALKIYPEAAKLFNKLDFSEILQDDAVIKLREEAWNLAHSPIVITNLNEQPLPKQPVLDHNGLIAKGKIICPEDEHPSEAGKPIAQIEKSFEPKPSSVPKPKPAVDPNGFLGGATPEILGKLMIRAISTGDKGLWNSCIHPYAENRKDIQECYDRIRERLEEAGVTNWSQIVFSRVTFSINGYGGNDDKGIVQIEGPVRGEKVRRFFKVDFTYRNKEFAGTIGDIPIISYQGKNYFMMNNSSARMSRL